MVSGFKNQRKVLLLILSDEKGNLISEAKTSQIVLLDNKISLKEKDDVYKTTSKKLKESILNLENKKIAISMHVIAKKQKPFTLIITDGENEISLSSVIVEKANKTPLTEERIKEKLKKLGNTPFILENITCEIENDIFIQVKDINELRRNIIEKLIIIRKNRKVEYQRQEVTFEKYERKLEKEISIEVKTEEKLKEVRKEKVNRIYVPKVFMKNTKKKNTSIK